MRLLSLPLAAALLILSVAVNAQEYPVKPIRVVVPYPPGGGMGDRVARLVSDKLRERWGQPLVVENRAGANANIGADIVAKAPPDGYTLLVTGEGPLTINKLLDPRLTYEPLEFTPVSILLQQALILVAHPKVPADNLAQLLAFAKANPGKLNLGTNGAGSNMHLSLELLKSETGTNITHVPYKGVPPALTDLVGGQIELMLVGLGTVQPLLKSGKLKVLAAGSEKRMALLPEVPSMTETVPGFTTGSWFGLAAPPKTPAAIANRLAGSVREFMKQPDVQKVMAELNVDGVGSTPAEMASFIKIETERWGRVIRVTGVKVE
jgi:tripartite-type tricarboxylate transporter receptor subunit TctC